MIHSRGLKFALYEDYGAKTCAGYPGVLGDEELDVETMLIIGNFGLSLDQARFQMAIWAVLAAPLLVSSDLYNMRLEFRDILLNKNVIAVNQQLMGKQGLRVWQNKNSNLEIWNRELHDGSFALAFVSRRSDGAPHLVTFSFEGVKFYKFILQESNEVFPHTESRSEADDTRLARHGRQLRA